MDDENKLKLLITKREYVFREIQIIYDLSIQVSSDKSKLVSFKCRFKRLEKIRIEYIDLTDEINQLKLLLYPDKAIDMQSVGAFDSMYFAVMEIAEDILSPPSDESAVTPAPCREAPLNAAGCTSKPSIARLPKIELVKFDGNVELWQTFYDTFVSLVHENQNISNIEKFHYLMSCLRGPALSLAKGIPITADNYAVVFKALIERYQNKRILAVNYLEKITNYSTLKTCNINDLRNLTSLFQESVNALQSIKIDNLGEFVLFYLSSRKLDSDTRKRFESQNKEQIPTFSDLLLFLQSYIKVLEASEPSVKSFNNNNSQHSLPKHQNNNNNRRSVSFPAHCSEWQNTGTYSNAGPYLNESFNTNNSRNNFNSNSEMSSCATANTYSNCGCCGHSHHTIYKCPIFQEKSLNDRHALVKSKQLCYNCLKSNHTFDKCFSKSCCFKCNGRHHTLLHRDQGANKACPVTLVSPAVPVSSADPIVTINSTNTSAHHEHGLSLVLLGTCVVRAHGPNGVMHLRALIDSGAQDCFITSACARRLGLPMRRCNVTISGVGGNAVHQIQGVTSFTIQPQYSNQPTFNIQAIVMDTITNKMPSAAIPVTVKAKYKHLVLADNNFDQSADIDFLIGAELFHNIYDGQRLDVGPGFPVALHSVFGWVITGRIDSDCGPPVHTTSLLASTLALDKVVKRFWEVEEPPKANIIDPETEKCEQLYTQLVRRNEDGRYVVPILLKQNHELLGDSYHSSLSRLYNLEKRFRHNDQLSSNYIEFMEEYENMNHMYQVKPSDKNPRYIIPHHCVLRPDSATTKLRVVFDASAKTTNGLSLNDIVHTGPKLQNDIVDIITKFRLHPLVFTADISKMYRNIELRPEDRKYQHILWRSSPSEEVREFELKTVTYGVSSSPYLAIRTLHQLAIDHGEQFPQAASILRQDTFMDDITVGAPSLEVGLQLKDQLVKLLDHAQFELRKWSSNSPEFLSHLPSSHCQVPKSFCEDSKHQTLKILGVQWDPNKDIFTYSQSELNLRCTKRSILSNVARIYDPLGWLTPMVLTAKILIQDLWRIQLNWDEPVPEHLAHNWTRFIEELKNLKDVRIPRLILSPNVTNCDLVGFCDGSSKAYGCCVYLRTVSNGKVSTNLLIAKSRVAPIKPLTINRLELLGAVLLARVLKHMTNLLHPHLNLTNVFAFTDSSTVLAWLNTEPYKLKTFVSHRVVKITDEVDPKNWRHVSTAENPADHTSRGLPCSQLISSDMWWSGPQWLKSELSEWPTSEEMISSVNVPEMKNLPHMVLTAESAHDDDDPVTVMLTNYSSLSKVQRILAWIMRFYSRSRKQINISDGLTTDELETSLTLLIRHEQIKFLTNDINSIKSKEPCSRPIQKLKPFIDQRGLMRVGGRLEHAQLPLSAIYPFILPKNSRLSILIIDFYHRLHLHCGPRTLQSIIQRKFWILGIRNLIRSRLSKCVTCFKVNPTTVSPIMGNLPSPRVQPTRCFQKIGVDFAGPFVVKESRRRNAPTYKVYVCVIVCLAVKAIHLELVTDLSTPAFIAALDRFVSRRGLCKLIISDCGTNFVGAKRYLTEVQQFLLTQRSNLHSECSKRNIIWQHNPPTGSHFGGIFESGVKSMKHHLKRVVGLQTLTYEELLTVLNKIEAVLNSRPLCAISSDPCEVDVLTPGHFLTGGPLVSLPEVPLVDTYIPPRERWQLLQKLTQGFWKVWQNEYLHTLQQRNKWFKGQANVQIGDIVTIVEQNLPPLEWRFGRVTELHPGSDGIVRVVTIRTANGFLRRPVVKICPLPLTE